MLLLSWNLRIRIKMPILALNMSVRLSAESRFACLADVDSSYLLEFSVLADPAPTPRSIGILRQARRFCSFSERRELVLLGSCQDSAT
jgi:hypothetical protein